MKVPYTWLKELIPLRMPAEAIAGRLTMAGLEVGSIEKSESGDKILDVTVTSNRPDCLGMVGIAREVCAILSSGGMGIKKPKFPQVKLKESNERAANLVKVLIMDKPHCHRYTARLIRNVRVAESPQWLKDRLIASGLRPINNVVDVTNYVLMEYGQPLHAFDFNKIKDRKIVVRRARDNEEITSLDGKSRKLDRSILVIADSEKPQAIAGIIGGADSQVTSSTTDILLESAYFEKGIIRYASKKLGVSTDSSYRFERGADKEAVELASARAASLIHQLAGGEILKGSVDIYPHPPKPVKIYLRLRRINEIIGVEIEKSKIRSILRALGLVVEKSDNELWRIHIPCFRRDLRLEIDLIEEITRHFGYTSIPAALPSIMIRPPQKEGVYQVYENMRDMMVSSGFYEVINFSFMSLEEMENARPGPEREPGITVTIKNPISDDQAVMRISLVHGLLKNIEINLSRGEKDIRLFEIGNIFYLKKGDESGPPREEYCLAGISLGNTQKKYWRADKSMDFYDIKGVVELITERLGIDEVSFRRGSVGYLMGDSSCIIYVGAKPCGWIGEIKETVLKLYDINERVFLFELYLDEIMPSVRKIIYFKEPTKFPAGFRDISIIVHEEVTNNDIVSSMRKTANAYLEKIELLDLYRGEQVPSGKKSLTYRLSFRSGQRTLREEEINDLFSSIISGLKSSFSVELRK